MKIKDGFILREVAGNYIVVAIGKRVNEFKGVISLNETGVFMWKLLVEGIEKEELVSKLLEEYDVTREDAEKDCFEFIDKLKEAGLFIEP